MTAWRNGDELEFAEPDWELDLPGEVANGNPATRAASQTIW
jgi:hypothetical protein